MVIRRLIAIVAFLLQVALVKAQEPTVVKVPYGTPVTLGVNNPNGNYTYQWYRDGRAMANQTRSTLTVTAAGNYQVLAINQGDCASDLSDVFSVVLMTSDLQVIKKSEARHVGPNETFEYYITARNNGNSDNTNIVVTDRLPSNLKFIAVDKTAAVYEEGLITWRIPSLTVGQEETLVVKVQGKMQGLVTNTANIQSNNTTLPDLVPENNSSTDTKKIIGNIKIPNVITPNGDGKNDVLKVDGIELYKENSISIFNRWGNEVYRSQGYQNDWNGNGLSEGTYFYVLKLVSREGVSSSVTGYITLLRDK
ncbi:gliding motility-associated C-terminal domain-containing protein [Pedobacter sp. SL55]|uniref:T9SS type B sorting domain-containing protein n=1 Tax=Pedobacter sp. SL55 TaxID=2995161 RepID=UPI002271CE5B|nr:gliding motility-associated C-terminal domain-containing protein [Pedobacter sp. SL55]WAC40486.1 gliding motility-associated C-terminal domain-containing protein [Pedobacter sp. SL55]